MTARNVTGRVDTLERDGLAEPLPHPRTGGPLGPAHPGRDRLAGELLTAQRAALAELLAEVPEADQRHLLQPWSRYGPCWHDTPDSRPLATSMARNGQPRRVL